MLKNMKKCPKHRMYPSRFDKCPSCHSDAKSAPRQNLTTDEMIARLSNAEVEYIFRSVYWKQGTAKTRQLCLAEFDKRFGLAKWPEHISKE